MRHLFFALLLVSVFAAPYAAVAQSIAGDAVPGAVQIAAEQRLTGGTSFTDAVPFPQAMLGQEFSLENHVPRNRFATFVFDLTPGQIMDVTMRSGNAGVRIDEVGDAQETELPYAGFVIYSQDRVRLAGKNIIGRVAAEEGVQVGVNAAGRYYLFLGSTYADMHRDTRFTVTVDAAVSIAGGGPAVIVDDTPSPVDIGIVAEPVRPEENVPVAPAPEAVTPVEETSSRWVIGGVIVAAIVLALGTLYALLRRRAS